ncbi:hypothetical protein DBV15_00105 [Temnothorax longispinosus]|uniref:Uncharacterized protein n=1 Tax=Temnothorax longispinosus TaxID=300112 RepID=A0A4S2KDS2_9HYME|nr:hypothetical protein DBV15_00105 [Temnothorax longispinosus]
MERIIDDDINTTTDLLVSANNSTNDEPGTIPCNDTATVNVRGFSEYSTRATRTSLNIAVGFLYQRFSSVQTVTGICACFGEPLGLIMSLTLTYRVIVRGRHRWLLAQWDPGVCGRTQAPNIKNSYLTYGTGSSSRSNHYLNRAVVLHSFRD